MTLELTTKFRGISTSPAARQRKGEEAHPLKRCYGALNYIARENASGIISWHGLRRPDGKPATTPKEARLALRRRFREEAAKGGKVGRRIATTGIVSLPNTWSEKTVRLAVERLARELAPEGSEASAIVIQHIDKSHNAHLHFLAVDGVESKDAAARRTDKRAAAQRVRRQNVQRFNERGAPKRWRGRIATILNTTAKESGEAEVEWRSFKERGLKRQATQHDSPQKRAQAKRSGFPDSLKRLFENDEAENVLDAILGISVGVAEAMTRGADDPRERGVRE